ncbi:luciferase family oxidoreductase, group 1 [Rhizobium sp. RU20A]|uniref:LLM class flavin-dependent oxidoreductase n=1 Tax=Rhizobium sp. RU20A TaxID=1907412 RepID=UPI000957143F|nr:LLM class flavin-dependent oxidoreductase [Rhizobium sp. RU20A]SIQ38101.1 luciferase family oxidoreductase, group 1 [Rhizobium sp. RU20A]
MTDLSILDLSPINQGSTVAQSLENSRQLAIKAESLGYRRFWLAEHHGMPGIASAATALVIQHVAAATKTIRVGSGGIMLPNHSPLVIAEQFGTLEALFPGRIDLGLGRAPGTDMKTARALRRNLDAAAENFPQDVIELMRLLGPADQTGSHHILAVPGAGAKVPVWLLGSSHYSAHLAGILGLPFAFASHFAPDMLLSALEIYRERFEPSGVLDKPHVMVGAMAVAADTATEAAYHFTSMQQSFLRLRRGTPGAFPAPVETMDGHWSDQERIMVEHTLQYAMVGDQPTVRRRLAEFQVLTGADEIILSMPVYDMAAKLRSLEIFADARETLKTAA